MEILAELRSLKNMEIKPNYSELSRRFKKDRHTIRKMYDSIGKGEKERKPKPSCLDSLKDEIAAVLSDASVSVRSAYWYFRNEKGISCTYSNFKQYARKHSLNASPMGETAPHPLYETAPGKVLQCDWVESLKLRTSSGETVEFNLFSATLGYSRLHYFEYTDRKNEAAFKRCLIHCLKWLGGSPKEVLTDNMSALVSISGGRRKVHPSVTQFARDMGVAIRYCDVRTPETKGKDETSNKYAKWMAAYDGKVESRESIRKLVERLVRDVNAEPNSSTLLPPSLLFQKEKEHLSPLPSRDVLAGYEGWSHSIVVPKTQFVAYRGSRYSVPPNLITSTVQIEEDGDRLLIFSKGLLAADHPLQTERGGVSLAESHLREGIAGRIGADSPKIDEYISQTISNFRDFMEARNV